MGKFTRFPGFKAREEIPASDPSTAVVPPSRTAAPLTIDSALGIIPVYRAISILATAASQLTLDVWRGADPLPKPALVRKPDVNASLSAFVQDTVTSMVVSGNAYWRLDRNARNEVVNARVLNPWECVANEDGTLGWKDKTLKPGEFHHLKLLRVPGRLTGLGPIQACRTSLQGSQDLGEYQAAWFGSGDVPSGILKTDAPLSKDQADEYADQWASRDAHKVAVLGSGLDYRAILLNPEDAQFLQVAQFNVTGIARLFGIPAHLLLAAIEGTSMTYTNTSQADLTFVRWTLMQYLREIEEAFTACLPGQQTARFNLDAILRADTTTRYLSHQVALSAGFATPNEIRATEGLPPLPGGNTLSASTPKATPNV